MIILTRNIGKLIIPMMSKIMIIDGVSTETFFDGERSAMLTGTYAAELCKNDLK